MAGKQHTHRKSGQNPRRFVRNPFENFVERKLQKSLIELVNARSWARAYIELGRIRTLSQLIDEAQRNTGKKYHQVISVMFKEAI